MAYMRDGESEQPPHPSDGIATSRPKENEPHIAEGEQYHAYVLIQDRHGGGFIGRKGVSINQLREASHCTMTLQDRKLKFLSRRPVRALKMKGTPDEITTAIRLTAIKIKNVQADNIAHKSSRTIDEVLEDEGNATCELTLLSPQGLITNELVTQMAEHHCLNINITPVGKHWDVLDFSGDAMPISLACRTFLNTIWDEANGGLGSDEIDESKLVSYDSCQGPTQDGPPRMPFGGGMGFPNAMFNPANFPWQGADTLLQSRGLPAGRSSDGNGWVTLRVPQNHPLANQFVANRGSRWTPY